MLDVPMAFTVPGGARSLGSNGIADEGGLAVADGLAHNTSLKYLK